MSLYNPDASPRRLGLDKIHVRTHFPEGTSLVTETEAGPIYRLPLKLKLDRITTHFPIIPDFLTQVSTSGHNQRKGFTYPIRQNSWRVHPYLGKPDSAFLACHDNQFCLDVLEEREDYVRPTPDNVKSPQLHDIIRRHIKYTKALYTLPPYNQVAVTALSGHLVPLNITTPDVAYIFVADALHDPDSYLKAPRRLKTIIHTLWTNRIAVMTSNGYLVLPTLQHSQHS